MIEASNVICTGLLAYIASAASSPVRAAVFGGPEPGQIGFLPAVTENAEDIQWLHNWILLPVIIGISLLVLALLIYVVYRFNEKANPVASRRTHNACARSCMDGRAGAPARNHCGAIVPSADAATCHPAARSHTEGHGLAVALELRLSESRGRISNDSLIVEDKDRNPATFAFSQSTIRSSCRSIRRSNLT